MAPTRRQFLLAGLAAAGSAVTIDAFGLEARHVRVTRRELRLPRLASALDGVRVAHITDVHLPDNRAAARDCIDHLARERPEIVLLTGDICENERGLPALHGFARAVRGSVATLATLGNWERRAALERRGAREMYERAGVRLLVNEHAVVELPGRGTLAVVGLDDLLLGGPDPRKALRGLQRGGAELWMIHEPAHADLLPASLAAGPMSLFAGHTHGGQICLPTGALYTPAGSGRYVSGWYETPVAPMFVSRGVGTVVLPARLFCPAELAIFTLRAG